MKRGGSSSSSREDEKSVGPMFPRLHVNDADKGGPRAPPRNKMALYELLSVPSQQHAATPHRNLNSFGSNQENGSEKSLPFPIHSPQSDRVNVYAAPPQRKRGGDDFMVPVLQSRMAKLLPLSQSHSHRGIKITTTSVPNKIQRQKNDQECENDPVPTFNRSFDGDACLQQDSRWGSQLNNNGQGDGLVESNRDAEKGTVLQATIVSRFGENATSPNEPDNGSRYRACSPQRGNADRGDDVSETSMVDCVSGVDISPDDVVGIIGQKHFWKARKAIVNQQRLFAVQVFELHRLVKVQQLIAGSPHILLEDSAFLSTSLKGSPAKKLAAEYVVKPLLLKRKHESEKPNHKMECSAENTVEKASLSSVKNSTQPSHHGPYVGTPPHPAPLPAENKGAPNPWCFHQPPGHQYLIPVMSPSEGLVYKPYNGPEFVGGGCGGCGPFGSSPMTGNFMKSGFGVPGPHHQGMGVIPVPHPTYFPPYGMSVMNPAMSNSVVEQMNWFAGPGMHGPTDQMSGNSNLQHQSSCNMPTPKTAAIPRTIRSRASNPSELQGSTANSPGDRAPPIPTDQTAGESDAPQLFPAVPAVPERVPQTHDTNQATRVIRVVPHNPRSATASAARIFQSIQEERKQYD